jgi:AraC-like DNA-binding protein
VQRHNGGRAIPLRFPADARPPQTLGDGELAREANLPEVIPEHSRDGSQLNDPPKSSLPRLLVFGSLDDTVKASLEAGAHVAGARSGPECLQLFRKRPYSAVLLCLASSRGLSRAPLIAAMRSLRPNVPLVGIVHVARRGHSDTTGIVDAIRAGLSQTFFPAADDTGALLTSLRAQAPGLTSRVKYFLHSRLPPGARPLLETIDEAAASGANLKGFRDITGLSDRTVLRQCQRSGIMAPGRVLRTLRLAHVLDGMMIDGWPIQSAAGRFGYSSREAVHRSSLRLLGRSVAQLASEEGSQLLERFAEALKKTTGVHLRPLS